MIANDETVEALRRLGWDIVQHHQNEFDWLKFDAGGSMIAQGGDAIWASDILTIEAGAVEVIGGEEIWEQALELRWMYYNGSSTAKGVVQFPMLQQKWRRVAGGPACGGGSTEWRDVPSVDAKGKPME